MTLIISLSQAKIDTAHHRAPVTQYKWHLTDHASCHRRIMVRHFPARNQARPGLFFVQMDTGSGLMVNDNIYAFSIEDAWEGISKFLALHRINCQPINR